MSSLANVRYEKQSRCTPTFSHHIPYSHRILITAKLKPSSIDGLPSGVHDLPLCPSVLTTFFDGKRSSPCFSSAAILKSVASSELLRVELHSFQNSSHALFSPSLVSSLPYTSSCFLILTRFIDAHYFFSSLFAHSPTHHQNMVRCWNPSWAPRATCHLLEPDI